MKVKVSCLQPSITAIVALLPMTTISYVGHGVSLVMIWRLKLLCGNLAFMFAKKQVSFLNNVIAFPLILNITNQDRSCVRFSEIPLSVHSYTGNKSVTRFRKPCKVWASAVKSAKSVTMTHR